MSRSVKKKNIFHSPSQSWDREMQIKFLKGLTQDKTGHLNRGKSCHLRAAERKAPSSLVAQHCHFQVRIFHLNISRLGLSPEYSQKKPSSRSANCCHSECHKNGSHLFWQKMITISTDQGLDVRADNLKTIGDHSVPRPGRQTSQPEITITITPSSLSPWPS